MLPRLVIAALTIAALAAPPAHAVGIDALGTGGDQRVDLPPYASADRSAPDIVVAGVGDVDGDGREDAGVVLDTYEPAYGSHAWISFAPASQPSTTTAGGPGWAGMHITASRLYPSLAGLGDVNGDGRGEVVVHDGDGLAVVFGRSDGVTVDTGALGAAGFRVTGVGPGVGLAFGTSWEGAVFQNTRITSAGDQDGDGRDDLAFADGGVVRVAFTPHAPAGAVLDSDALGDGGFTLWPSGGWDPHVGRLSDLDGDGRDDLAVVWEETGEPTVRAAGAVAPEPGATVDLTGVAEAGTGFELVAPDSHLDGGYSYADRNGDGQREIGLRIVGGTEWRPRTTAIAFTPPLGTTRTVWPLDPAHGVTADGTSFVDVGDQDGDGRPDGASHSWLHASASSGAALGTGMIGAAVGDRTGDGRHELVAVHASPYREDAPYAAHWHMDVYSSSPTPAAVDLETPVQRIDGVEVAATFVTVPTGVGSRSLAALPMARVVDAAGNARVVTTGIPVDANAHRTRVAVVIPGLDVGATYRYQLLLENGRGLTGATEERSFTFTGLPEASQPPPATPVATFRVRTGNRKANRLKGTAGRDWLRGLGGRDVLLGRGGADRLDGGRGKDRLVGGSGKDELLARDRARDRVECGPGRDTAVVDRRDRVRGCERVLRARPSSPSTS